MRGSDSLLRRRLRVLRDEGLLAFARKAALRVLMSSRSVVLFVRAVRFLRREGLRRSAREAMTRIAGRLRHGLPLSSPAAYFILNRDYRRWLHANTLGASDLRKIVCEIERLGYRPLISILVPIYNTDRRILNEAIASVLGQAYPQWELCLVNDASTRSHVRPLLDRYAMHDSRIKVKHLERNAGIAGASDHALTMATGDFVALLDHDDTLTPDALFEVVRLLNDRPELDLIYSDEDKMTARGKLVDPFFKPSWSPDLLRSMNYITHLCVFRTSQVRTVGGFRAGFDGSQDYDLLLRVTENSPNIAHIPRVLYHYRQTAESAALNPDAKPYAYEAAVIALRESLERLGHEGFVQKRSPGYYHVRYAVTEHPEIALVVLGPKPDLTSTVYPNLEFVARSTLGEALQALSAPANYLVICDGAIEVIDPAWIDALLEHAQRTEVGAVGPVLFDHDDTVAAAGLLVGGNGWIEPAFSGWSIRGWGTYFGILQSTRNCTALGGCMMLRTPLLEKIGGGDGRLRSPAAELDLCLRLRRAGYNIVCTPHARLRLTTGLRWHPNDKKVIRNRWSYELSQRDTFLNPNLVMTAEGVRMDPASWSSVADGPSDRHTR